MRIRLTGTRDELDAVLPALAVVLDVLEVSEFHRNRGDSVLGRVYVEVAGVRPPVGHATANRTTSGVAEAGVVVRPTVVTSREVRR